MGTFGYMLPFAFAENERAYLAELADGRRVPLAFVNGPAGRQIGVDHEQGLTTEEVNIALARSIELALVNLAGLPPNRGGAFGTVQALVFSEDDEACLAAGWQPWHVQQGYALDDNTVTMTTFDMWGNNSTPATDWPEEIMKLVAWDATEKNLGGLGAAPTDAHAATYILRPDGTGAPLVVSDLADAPAFAVTLSGTTIPGAAFAGLPPRRHRRHLLARPQSHRSHRHPGRPRLRRIRDGGHLCQPPLHPRAHPRPHDRHHLLPHRRRPPGVTSDKMRKRDPYGRSPRGRDVLPRVPVERMGPAIVPMGVPRPGRP